MGGEEEEVLRIAKRLDKMVAKKSVVSGGHRRCPPPSRPAEEPVLHHRRLLRRRHLRQLPLLGRLQFLKENHQSVLAAAMATPAPHRLENGPRPGQPLGPASPPLFKYFSRWPRPRSCREAVVAPPTALALRPTL